MSPVLLLLFGIAKDVKQACSTQAKVNRRCENSVESNRSTKEWKAGTSVSKGSVKKSLAKTTKLSTGKKLEQLYQKCCE